MMCSALVLAALLTAQGAVAPAARTLNIYFVDVEGGQATLVVTPAGESLLVDTGWGGANGRDAKRIMAVAREAGLTQIDYLLITHFHSDHDGGAPELSRLIPIRTFVDYGEATEKGKKVQEPFDAYARSAPEGGAPRAEGGRPAADQGPRHPDRQRPRQDAERAAAGWRPGQSGVCGFQEEGERLHRERRARSGSGSSTASSRFLDLGDLVWNELGQLVCPKNMLGRADVYLMAHHGNAFSGVPAVTAAVQPRVVILNNGETKGGDAKTFTTLQGLPGLEDLWQLHRSTNKGAKQADEAFIANLSEDTAYRVTLSASEDGSFTLSNARTGFTKRYAPK